ncbi:hypothetical protein CRUP_010336, partial [Coryphaenoides rupestris]
MTTRAPPEAAGGWVGHPRVGGTLSPGQIVPSDGHLLEQGLHGGDAAVVVAGAQQVLLPMSRAGFVHCPSENEPAIACCFYCVIELEDWEPDDDPRIKWSPNCRFLTMDKVFSELTLAEFLHMEKDRLKIYL